MDCWFEDSPLNETNLVATLIQNHTFTINSNFLFDKSKILGLGSYGVVASAFDIFTKTNVAIKRIRPYKADEIIAKQTLREIRCLKLLGAHPNVSKLLGLSINDKKQELYFVMELMETDMHKIISRSEQTLSEAHIKCLMKQLLEGLKAIHSVGIIHRDIKPANILVKQDCQLRITDFGMSRFIDKSVRPPNEEINRNSPSPLTEYVVTRWYRAPELLLAPTMAYSEAIDLWSAGCILAEMVNRRPLFPGQGYIDQVQQIFAVLGLKDAKDLGFPVSLSNITFLNTKCRFPGKPFARLFPSLSVEALELLESLLTVNPLQRCSAPSALSAAFFSDAETLFDYSDSSAVVSLPSADYFDFEKMTFDSSKFGDMIRMDVADYYNGNMDNNNKCLYTTDADRTSIESVDIEQDEVDDECDTYEISIFPNGSIQKCVPRSSVVSLPTKTTSLDCSNPFGKQNSSLKRRDRLKTFPVTAIDPQKVSAFDELPVETSTSSAATASHGSSSQTAQFSSELVSAGRRRRHRTPLARCSSAILPALNAGPQDPRLKLPKPQQSSFFAPPSAFSVQPNSMPSNDNGPLNTRSVTPSIHSSFDGSRCISNTSSHSFSRFPSLPSLEPSQSTNRVNNINGRESLKQRSFLQ